MSSSRQSILVGLFAFTLAFSAGTLPTNARALNEVASLCQLPGAYLTETGLERLINLGVTELTAAFLNPVDDLTTRQKKKIQKAAVMLGGGVFAMTVCPPLIVDEGFSDWDYDTRVDYARDTNWSPIDIAPMDDLLVDNPADPGSCRASLQVDLDAAGRLNEGIDFPDLEFVYVDPFGSFPNGTDLFNSVLADIKEQIRNLINQYLSLSPAEDLLANIDAVNDRIVAFISALGINPTLNDLIPGIEGFILDLIGLAFNFPEPCDSVDFECDFRLKFDKWATNLLELRDDGAIEQFSGGFRFPDGPGEVSFLADINTGFSTPIGYVQELFVTEYFAPTFDVLFEENGFSVIADLDFEALEPGLVDRSYTPPSFQAGEIAVTDNCDPDPFLGGGPDDTIAIGGPFYPEVFATDRSGNMVGRPDINPVCLNPGDFPQFSQAEIDRRCTRYAVKVEVMDTRPPDLAPKDPIGITVDVGTTTVNFTDPEIGCATPNCQTQINPPIPPLQPPAVFDFAQADFGDGFTCTASNSLGADQPCASAVLPVGETTTVDWTYTDLSGNSSAVTQLTAVREDGVNQAPAATGTTVTVAQNTSADIPLEAGDPEFDPISYIVKSLPLNGTLDVMPDPQFQTRFTATGTITDFVDALRVEGDLSDFYKADILADSIGKRLVAVIDFEGIIDALYFETVQPDSIGFREGDYIVSDKMFEQSGPVVQNLLIGDWTTRRIHGLESGTNSLGAKFVPDGGYALPVGIDNPAHFELEGDYLYVTDPDPVNPASGQMHVIELGSVASSPENWTTTGVRSITLGYNGEGITRVSHPECFGQIYSEQFVLGDWDGQTARLLDFSDNTSPVSGGATESPTRTWDISAVLTDPDGTGDNRADIGSPGDLGLLSNSCRGSTDPLIVRAVDDLNKDIDDMSLTFSSTTVPATPEAPETIVTEFVRLFGVDATGVDDVLTLDKQRIARFDLFGNLKANIQTYKPDPRGTLFGSFENDRLIPIDSSQWVAMDVDPGGNVFLLSFGEQSTQANNEVVKVTVDNGSNNFTEQAATELTMPASFTSHQEGRAIAFSGGPTSGTGDDVVYLLTEFGVERYDSTLSNSTILFEAQDSFACSGTWCATVSAEFPDVNLADVDTDAMGNVYFSDLTNHRVHKFGHNGAYVGWLGACDSGVDCDIPNGRSIGFLCTNATCSVSSASGNGQGQFTFDDQPVDQDKPRPSSAMLEVNIDAEQIYVTDNPDLGAGAVPRAQIFSLSGVFVSETIGDGSNDPNDFLDAGDFNAINDLSTTTNKLFLIEDQPLKRLHVFDISPFRADLDGATVTYTPDNAYSGPDGFSYAVVDSFGAESPPALVDITVVGDSAPPTISCPADITVEATEPGGASRATFERGDRGSVALADFFEGATFSDDIQLPPAVLDIQIPVPGATLDYVFPVNATTPVQFQVTDGVGNFTNCVAEVTVEDTIRPSCNRPAPPVLVQNGDGPPQLQVVDCLDSTVTSRTRNLRVITPVGVERAEDPQLVERGIETTTITDEGGNETTVVQEYEIRDTEPPTFLATPVRGAVASQAAVNGYANAYSLPGPAVADAADVTVECQPALSGTAASVPLTFFCQAKDAHGNLAYTTFDYEIVQENADADAFSDLVDPRPAVGDDSDTWSDTPLGGATSGTYTPDASGGDFRIIDAYLAGQGVRAEWTAPGPGASTNDSVVSACGDTLQVSGFGVKLDEIGDVDVSAVSVTCGPSVVRNHLGAISAAWTLPNDFEAVSALPESAGLVIDGYIATADADNGGPIDVQVADNTLQLAPGETVDLQPFANFRPTAAPVSEFALLEDAQTGGQLDLAAVFDDTEDADVDLTYAVQASSGGDLLEGLSINGTLLSFDAGADAFGTATLVASATDTGGLSASVDFDVVISPVNDAPVLSLAGNVEAFDFDGNTSIAGFATASPGPANEAAQTVDISVVDVSNPGLFASGPVIDGAGALVFTPNLGAQGTASVEVVAVDSGGTDNGGDDTDQQAFDIFVEQAERADVSVSITASDRFVDPQQSVEYTIEVVNNGPEDVVDVLVESAVPTGLVDVTWFCVASDGACGAPNGAGDVAGQQVSIQSGGMVSYTLTATVDLPEGEDIVSAATATPPAEPVDTNTANNGDSVTVTVGLYVDGFEAAE